MSLKFTLVTHTIQREAKTAGRRRVGRRPIPSGHRLAVHVPTIGMYNKRTYIARTTAYSSAGLPARCVRAEHTPAAAKSPQRSPPLHAQRRHACLMASLRPQGEASSAASTSAPLPLLASSSPVESSAARAVHLADLWVKCTPQKVAVPAQTAGRPIHRTDGWPLPGFHLARRHISRGLLYGFIDIFLP